MIEQDMTAGKVPAFLNFYLLIMTIYFVDKPHQGEQTLSPQLIEGKIYYWIVRSECMKIGESFQQWIDRKTNERNLIIEKDDILSANYRKIKGIVVHDFTPLMSINSKESAMMIRYAYLTN